MSIMMYFFDLKNLYERRFIIHIKVSVLFTITLRRQYFCKALFAAKTGKYLNLAITIYQPIDTMADVISERYPVMTAEQNALDKNWACGSKEVSEHSEFVIHDNGTAGFATINYAPAWWKIIDEVLVNAIDHFIRQYGSSDPVTQISFDFAIDGSIKVWNDGLGIDVCIHPAATVAYGREIWVPTFLFGMLNQSGNHKPNADSIIGGTNGFGAKLARNFGNC